MRRAAGVALALVFAGFVGAWVCLRTLCFGLALVVLGAASGAGVSSDLGATCAGKEVRRIGSVAMMRAVLILVLLGSGCATMERHQLATGTTIGTVVVSPAIWAGWYVAAGRPFARPAPVPQKAAPCDESWHRADDAAQAEADRRAARAAEDALIDADGAARTLVRP